MSASVVCVDARRTRQMSIGMKTYVDELQAWLPRVAPDLSFVFFTEGANFGLTEQLALPLAMRAKHPAISHIMSQYAPLFTPRPYVLTIHDLIHLRFPQFFKTKVGPYYRSIVRLACARAARVITDDPRTIEDLERFLGVTPAKVRVVPLGVGAPFTQPAEPMHAPRPYLLYVGNHRLHKDLPTLIEAWSSLPERYPLDLYLTGPDDFDGELQRRSRPSRQASALGDVDDATLARWYAGARALVHPALREGFGLPLLEAAAAGCPLIACADAVPNVLERAALTFAAKDVGALRAHIERIMDDNALRQRLIDDGRAIARTLTWEQCARETVEVYREVLASR